MVSGTNVGLITQIIINTKHALIVFDGGTRKTIIIQIYSGPANVPDKKLIIVRPSVRPSVRRLSVSVCLCLSPSVVCLSMFW